MGPQSDQIWPVQDPHVSLDSSKFFSILRSVTYKREDSSKNENDNLLNRMSFQIFLTLFLVQNLKEDSEESF